ncbi:protein of unknown function [Shewanella benthica]|uniref:DUF6701 domain-containing protein n=1 Tax=Shewanella benthica TaxID=43661 RepID=A0A330LX52_9GAMM|nr:DUF6701 domain-containing protein [Shewanella benthica]SQH74919.1 protein of unknown function [Shewanella benthica]
MIKVLFSKIKFLFINILAALLVLISTVLNSALAADWSKTFIEGVNSYTSLGEVILHSGSKLHNPPSNRKQPSHSVFDYQGSACVTSNGKSKECRAGNYSAELPDDRIPFVRCTSSSNQNIGPSNAENYIIDVPEGEYASILSNRYYHTLRFSANDNDGIYKIKSLNVQGGTLDLAPGQYWIEDLQISDDVDVQFPSDGTVSFFVKNHYVLDNRLLSYRSELFLLYGYSDIDLAKDSYLRGHIVSEGKLIFSDGARVDGAITSDYISIAYGGRVYFDSNASRIDVVPDCDSVTEDFALQFGKATSGAVVFETPFADGVTPLVFVMPTISSDDPNDNDGPASVFLTRVSNTGFSWRQVEPAIPWWRSDLNSRPMNEVHWVATTEGEHQFSDGTKFVAGFKDVKDVLYKDLGKYKKVSLSQSYDVVLNQIQSSVNNCWLTSTVMRNGSELSIGIDVSEAVYAGLGKYCLPGYVRLSQLKPERVAYLALESGTGKISIDGKDIQYQFGSDFWTSNSWDSVEANQQCSILRPLVGFTKTPIFVAGKHSRYDNNGGWLRRCQLTKNTVSMVTDEDRYQNSERDHAAEKYGFVALEVIEDIQELVHHFEFDYSSSPLTCNAEEMTIRACRNASCDLFTDPVTATLSPETMANGGWVGGSVVSLVSGTAKVSLRSNTTDPVTIGVTSSFPSRVAGSDTLCRQGAGPLNTASCTISFAESGFIFDIPDEFSNKSSTDILLKAVKQGDSQQCVPAFKNKAKSLAFWSDYKAPSTGTKKISVKSGTTEEDVGSSEATATALTLNFDNNGEAKIDVNYADAGNMQLNVRYTGSADESGLIMDGSDLFVRRPVGLCVESEACTNCSVTSSKYKRAGEEFDITVKAMAWQSDGDGDICSGNIITPNFTHKNMELSHDLISPLAADGGATGSLGLREYEQTAGEQTIKQSVSEVGIFTFSVTPKVGVYFGYDIAGATTENMGRFTPYYLSVTPEDPELLPTCVSFTDQFTYMDEPFRFKTGAEPRLLVLGKNKDGNETKNYQVETWWKYINQWNGRIFGNLAGSSLPSLEEIDPTTRSVAFLDGVAGGSRSAYLQDGILRYRRTSTPMAPFDALFELRLPANDLKDIDGICYQESAMSTCVGITFEEVAQGDDFELRYGRMVLENGYGPETESLRIPVRTEYVSEVTGPMWVVNRDDDCSVYNTDSSFDTGEMVTTGLNMTFPAGFPSITAYSNAKLTLQNGTIQNSVNQIYFTVPNATGVVPLKQHVEPWLKWYWNFDGNKPNVLYDPRASAFFGTYRGHDKVIYWREVN